jgi:hypothetical protein
MTREERYKEIRDYIARLGEAQVRHATDKQLLERCFEFINALYENDYAAGTIERLGLEDEFFAVHELLVQRLFPKGYEGWGEWRSK